MARFRPGAKRRKGLCPHPPSVRKAELRRLRAMLDLAALEPRLAAGGAGRIFPESAFDCAFVSHTATT